MKSFVLVMFVLFFALLGLDGLATAFSVAAVCMIVKETVELEEEKRGRND